MRQHRRVNRVGLGQAAGGPGKVPHLARVHDDHGEADCRERCHDWPFQPSRRFENDPLDTLGLEGLNDRFVPAAIVVESLRLGLLADRDVQPVLGDIDPDVDGSIHG